MRGSIEQNVIFHLLVQAQPDIVQLLCRLGDCERGVPILCEPLEAHRRLELRLHPGQHDLELHGADGGEHRGLLAAQVRALRTATAALGIPWPDDVPPGDVIAALDGSKPLDAAFLEDAVRLLRGAGYTAFEGSPPERSAHGGVGAPYAHVTAPLRRLAQERGIDLASLTGGKAPGIAPTTVANDRTARVFATPGTPSSSTCPRHSSAITSPVTVAS